MITPKKEGHALVCIHEFPGFYDSWLSGNIDSEEESFAEHERETKGLSDDIDLASIIFDCMNYRACQANYSEAWLSDLVHELDQEFNEKLPLEFESMTSPRFYNFETDRLFAWIPVANLQAIYDRMVTVGDGALTFGDKIRERFTSYDGFLSSYPNDFEVWLEKPLASWDHNEIGCLLSAWFELIGADNEFFVYSVHNASETAYHAFEAGMDWAKFDAAIEALKVPA